MILRRSEYPRPNIRKKDSGQVEWAMGMFSLLILGILLCAQLQLAAWRTSSLYLEDALAASNLASALIDVREYGMTRRVVISDATAAYAIYCDAVRGNLQLDESGMCGNRGLISGPVAVADYIVYNVVGDNVTASRVGPDGTIREEWTGERGVLRAPNGTVVECTGVYSEITFPVEGFFGIKVQARKGNLADIRSEEEEYEKEEEDEENRGF